MKLKELGPYRERSTNGLVTTVRKPSLLPKGYYHYKPFETHPQKDAGFYMLAVEIDGVGDVRVGNVTKKGKVEIDFRHMRQLLMDKSIKNPEKES